MKQPKDRNLPIDVVRMGEWLNDFSGYRININEGRIDRWLQQFDGNDHDLAARILDAVDFITEQQMTHAFRNILNGLDGWNSNSDRRAGKWRFVAFSQSAGESGDTMLYKFRHANNLAGNQYNKLFIHISDLLREGLGPNDTIVFIDDFSATGTQVCKAWKEQIQELLPDDPRIYLVLIITSVYARERILDETDMIAISHFELRESDNIFSNECTYFDDNEKSTLLSYCTKADKSNPKGYGDCGFIIVFAHTCPNNSIPILHVRNRQWEGLFRRYD